jgi:uncharacterized membrane protein
MRFVGVPSLRIIWINFAHLFMVSLLPLATSWVAKTKLASTPVVCYAGLFVCLDIAYNVFEAEVLREVSSAHLPTRMRRLARRRSLAVLAIFATSMAVSFVAPRLGFASICAGLALHLSPEAPRTR